MNKVNVTDRNELRSLIDALSSGDIETSVVAIESAAGACRLLMEAAVANLAKGGDTCFLVAERLGQFGPSIVKYLSPVYQQTANLEVRQLAAIVLLNQGSHEGFGALLEAVASPGYACLAARCLAGSDSLSDDEVIKARQAIISRLYELNPSRVDLGPSYLPNWAKDTVVCLIGALARLGGGLPEDLEALFTNPGIPIEIVKALEERK